MKLITFLLLLTVSTVKGQTRAYYVSAIGSDSNNGLSESSPWKTIQKVESFCNSGALNPGDAILFKRGDQFTGKAVIASIWGKNAKSGTPTQPITLGTYGSGAKPVFTYPTGGTTKAESRVLFWFAGLNYWIVDGLSFTDLDVTNNKVTPANLGIPLYLGSDIGCNHWTINNVDISLCGMGIVLVGDFNLVQNCKLTNFKNLKSTPNTGGSSAYEDYGANPFTLLDGNDNTIINNYVSGGWSESLDFGFNGGFCEMFGSCSRNKFMYNTIIDCNGLSEFGANGATASSQNNLYAYNKLIDNGAMFYCNISGPFACQVGNTIFYNNTVVETANSRFALGSPNAGAGVTSPEALGNINLDSYMFLYNGTPTASVVYDVKNNVFNIANPLRICKSGEARLKHDYDVFKLSGGSSFALALSAHEVSTSAAIFKNTTSTSAVDWDLHPLAPLVQKGIYVNIDRDFAGNTVSNTPSIGIYESDGIAPPPPPPPPPTCTPLSETRTVACPTGQTGTITQVRNFICPDGVWTAWVNTVSNCSTPPPPPPPAPVFSYTYNNSSITITAPISGTYRLYKKVWFWTTDLKKGTYPAGTSTIDVSPYNGTVYMVANGKTYTLSL